MHNDVHAQTRAPQHTIITRSPHAQDRVVLDPTEDGGRTLDLDPSRSSLEDSALCTCRKWLSDHEFETITVALPQRGWTFKHRSRVGISSRKIERHGARTGNADQGCGHRDAPTSEEGTEDGSPKEGGCERSNRGSSRPLRIHSEGSRPERAKAKRVASARCCRGRRCGCSLWRG